MNLKELKQKLFEARPDFKREYEKYDSALEIDMKLQEDEVNINGSKVKH